MTNDAQEYYIAKIFLCLDEMERLFEEICGSEDTEYNDGVSDGIMIAENKFKQIFDIVENKTSHE